MMKISLLIAALLFVGCTKQNQKNADLEKALNASPSYKAACEQIRTDAMKICGNDPNCGGVEEMTSVKTAVALINGSPYLQKNDVDMLNTFLQIKKPTRADVNMGTAILSRDCWSVIHMVPWKGILGAVKKKVKGIDKEKENIKKMFRDRVFLMDANVPTFLKLSVKYVLIKYAGDSGLFKMEKGWEKGLAEMDTKMKTVRTALNTEYTKLLKEDSTAPNPDPEKQKFDPVAVSETMKKDLAMTQALGRELNNWINKNILD